MAALRASDAAGEEVAGLVGGTGERGVNTLQKLRFADLYELGIARRKSHGPRIILHTGMGGSYNLTIMLIVPEEHAAIVRASVFAAIALPCIVGALRTHLRWLRIICVVIAIPAIFEAVFGIWAIWLIQHYGAH